MEKNLTAAEASQQDIRVCDAPRRARRSTLPPVDPGESKLRKAEYRLGVLKYSGAYVETILFLRADGIEIGYYTIHLDLDGCFVDFTFYDTEKEVRAVYEAFCGYDDGRSLTEVLELDLHAMGYYIPELQAELTDLRLTCESNVRCGSTTCQVNCPLQEQYRPK